MDTENKYLSIFQWFIFFLANSIALPIVIGNVFLLTDGEISALMQRTFFLVGASSFIQAKFGHRYPIADGPAGSWVSIFVIFASISTQQGLSMTKSMQILAAGLIIAGLILFILGVTKWVRHLLFLFTPIVTGIFLFILAIQLSGVFVKGMLAVDSSTGEIDRVGFMLAMLIFLFIIFFSSKSKGLLKNYAISLGILIGWVLFIHLGKGNESVLQTVETIKFPEILPWGLPSLTLGMLVTAVVFSFLLLSNTFSAISAAKEAVPYNKEQFDERLNRATWAGGVSHLLSALFTTIAVVPLPATAGFVRLTKQYRILPFQIASIAVVIISLFPSVISFLASLPLPVASAALLATLIDMLGIALRSLTKQPLNDRNSTIIGVSLLVGIGIMFLPSDLFNGLPTIIQSIGKNGLLVGTLIAILFEQFWKPEKESAS